MSSSKKATSQKSRVKNLPARKSPAGGKSGSSNYNKKNVTTVKYTP